MQAADLYLRKLQQKVKEEEKAKFKRKTREPLDKEIELSQISNWTGESIVDINIKKKK